MPDVSIPTELLPKDGRFGSGPSKVREAGVVELSKRASTFLGTSHRQAPVRDVVGHLRSGLAELFSAPEGYEIVLGNGGTTAFWDIATLCLVEHKSQHLWFGEFSSKFAECAAAAPFLEAPSILRSEPGSHPDPVAEDGVDAYCLTHNETSTGVSMEIRRPVGVARRDGADLVLVDATSGAGGLRISMSEADAYYFAPQKCFGSDGGLWVAVLSPAAIERAGRLASSGRWVPSFLDLRIAIDNSRLNQTYNTPALATLLLFELQVEWMNANGGLEWAAGRCDRSAEIVYSWAERSSFAAPFVKAEDERSHVVATIDLDEPIDATLVATVLRDNGVVDTESYRKLGRNQLRFAMFPGIDPADLEALTACVDYVVSALS